jgi:LysR family glycine cleavage system transcriptional activator
VADLAALAGRTGPAQAEPKRWLYFNYAYQMVQAALTGQGLVLARLPLVAESLANGDLIEVLPGTRWTRPWPTG